MPFALVVPSNALNLFVLPFLSLNAEIYSFSFLNSKDVLKTHEKNVTYSPKMEASKKRREIRTFLRVPLMLRKKTNVLTVLSLSAPHPSAPDKMGQLLPVAGLGLWLSRSELADLNSCSPRGSHAACGCETDSSP